MSHNPELYQLLIDTIRQSPAGKIPFVEYMDLVLYHPQHGYYASQAAIVGPGGDFITSPHLGHDFGELLAVQFAEMWDLLERPNPFDVVEMGAGQGLIAADVLNYLEQHDPECLSALRYWIVEKSEAMKGAQQQRLAQWPQVRWSSLEELPTDLVGCLFANELVDALPVHQVVRTADDLQEVYVTVRGEGLDEVTGPLSTPALRSYFDFVGVNLLSPEYAEGYRTEVNLAALDWMAMVAEHLFRGYVLTIDYGYPASRYYGRVRSQGTLQCYYRHGHHDNPYSHIGHQDITAHVDFTALEKQGRRHGLEKIGVTQQGLFLMALGIGDRLNQLAQIQATDPQTLNGAIQRRQTLHQLINPVGLGNFMVLVQGKGVDTTTLKGLVVPPLA